VVVVRRKASSIASGWSWRLAGLALCAFFGLGFFSGAVGGHNSPVVQRTLDAFKAYKHGFLRTAALVREGRYAQRPSAAHVFPGAVALVEREDGLYALFASGAVLGPLSPRATDNLPIISGAALESAGAEQMVEYASVIVRAEAELSELISEMHLGSDGEASLFLDGSRTEIVLDVDHAALELERAAMVLERWHEREAEIAVLDMTVPGQAVIRRRETVRTASVRGSHKPAHSPATRAHLRRAVIAMGGVDGGRGGAGAR
jgi:hypothetical protein